MPLLGMTVVKVIGLPTFGWSSTALIATGSHVTPGDHRDGSWKYLSSP